MMSDHAEVGGKEEREKDSSESKTQKGCQDCSKDEKVIMMEE